MKKVCKNCSTLNLQNTIIKNFLIFKKIRKVSTYFLGYEDTGTETSVPFNSVSVPFNKETRKLSEAKRKGKYVFPTLSCVKEKHFVKFL